MIEVKKKEGESANAMMFRFTRRIKRSGVLKEANKRRFRGRATSKRSRRVSALHRNTKKLEIARAKKLGVL